MSSRPKTWDDLQARLRTSASCEVAARAETCYVARPEAQSRNYTGVVNVDVSQLLFDSRHQPAYQAVPAQAVAGPPALGRACSGESLDWHRIAGVRALERERASRILGQLWVAYGESGSG